MRFAREEVLIPVSRQGASLFSRPRDRSTIRDVSTCRGSTLVDPTELRIDIVRYNASLIVVVENYDRKFWCYSLLKKQLIDYSDYSLIEKF